MQKFRLVYVPFCADLKGITGIVAEKGGRYTIMIDSNQDADTQKHALRHELAHLAFDHLSFTRTLSEISAGAGVADVFGDGWEEREREADRYADTMTEQEFAELMQYAI